jgi:hypothetical protein
VREQHGHSQTTIRRSFQLFSQAVDPDEDKKSEESNVCVASSQKYSSSV